MPFTTGKLVLKESGPLVQLNVKYKVVQTESMLSVMDKIRQKAEKEGKDGD